MNRFAHPTHDFGDLDPLVAGIVGSRLGYARKYQKVPSLGTKVFALHHIRGAFPETVVPVTAVVFDRQFEIRKRKVNVVFAHGIERDRVQSGGVERGHDFGFIARESTTLLSGTRSPFQVAQFPLTATNSTRCFSHQRGSFVRWKGAPPISIASHRTESSLVSRVHVWPKHLFAMLTSGIRNRAHRGIEACLRTAIAALQDIPLLDRKRCAAMDTDGFQSCASASLRTKAGRLVGIRPSRAKSRTASLTDDVVDGHSKTPLCRAALKGMGAVRETARRTGNYSVPSPLDSMRIIAI